MADLRRTPDDVLAQQRFYGKYRGRIVDNADPNNMGRVQVEVPAIVPDQPLGWAMPCVPFAGAGVGLYLIPAVETLVWVEFEGGDLRHPIWSGCFWAADQLPEGAEPGVFMLQTEGGNIIKLSDNDETIEITHGGGAVITIESDTITVDSGSTKIVLDASAVTVNEGSLEVT
jgi:uncharacterized protein involved in type VI secretion and phage assembly